MYISFLIQNLYILTKSFSQQTLNTFVHIQMQKLFNSQFAYTICKKVFSPKLRVNFILWLTIAELTRNMDNVKILSKVKKTGFFYKNFKQAKKIYD